MQVEHELVVAAPVDAVRALLTDPDRSTACVPGLTVETFAPGEYGGRLRLRVGSTTVTYRGTATVSPADTVRLDLDGQEARGSGIAKGTLTVSLSGEGQSTRVGLDADIAVTGRLGSLDPAVLEDAARRLFARFGECIGAAAANDIETEPATGPEGGLVIEIPPAAGSGGTGEASAPTVETPATPPLSPRREPEMTVAGEDDLLADQRRRVWPLPPAVAMLMGLTAVGILGVVIWLLRRRRR